ncbi:hypothetical protein HK100_010038, partial [Physocladia obscura]
MAIDKKAELALSQIKTATTAASKADRESAADDLAALVKASGSSAVLVSYGILDALKKAAEDKKNQLAREGAHTAYSALAKTLTGLPISSEPALLRALPVIFEQQGDKAAPVKAASDAAGKNLIAYVVSLYKNNITVAQPYLCKYLPLIFNACGDKKVSKDLKTKAADAAVGICKALSINGLRDIVPTLINAQDGF